MTMYEAVPHRRSKVVAAALTVAVAVVATAVTPATAAVSPPPPWTYFGPRGPAFWGALSPDYRTCASGTEQSPIDLVRPPPVGVLPLRELATQTAGAVLQPEAVPNGVKYNCASPGGCGAAAWAGYTYDLVQAHAHVAGEHTVHGEVFPAEVHLVHAAADGNLLVVGVHLTVGVPNAGLEALLDATDATLPPPSVATADVVVGGRNATLGAADWATLVPTAGGWCQYAGSLTTPPCTEGVTWAVASEPLTASMEQLERAGRTLISVGRSVVSTERPVQPQNGRRVTCYSADM